MVTSFHIHRCRPLLVAALAFVALGCEATRAPAGGSPVTGADAAASTNAAVQLASWEETEKLIAEQQGKVVVVDVWSTWCTPCVKEFPGLVKLHQEHGEKVACMSINCNFTGAAGEKPEDARAEVERFLTTQGATFTNVISTTPDEQLFQKLEAAAVPVVRVYDKNGKLRKQFDNDEDEYGEEGFTYEKHIAPLVEELIAE